MPMAPRTVARDRAHRQHQIVPTASSLLGRESCSHPVEALLQACRGESKQEVSRPGVEKPRTNAKKGEQMYPGLSGLTSRGSATRLPQGTKAIRCDVS